MVRRSEPGVGAVELPAARAAEVEAEVSDRFLRPDPLEDECRTRVEASGCPAVRAARLVASDAHRRETDADEPLRRPAPGAPEPSPLPGRAVVDLAGLSLPRPRAGLAAPHLDHVRP